MEFLFNDNEYNVSKQMYIKIPLVYPLLNIFARKLSQNKFVSQG